MRAGDIVFHKDFVFADGKSAHKFLVILGASADRVIAAKTTSNGSRYRLDHGCQAGSRFPAFLLTQGCCCLPLSTWVCLSDFYELSLVDLQAKVVAGDVHRYGVLSPDVARDVQVCAAGCDDISSNQEAIVRACFVVTT